MTLQENTAREPDNIVQEPVPPVPRPREPLFNIPGVLIAYVALMTAIELVRDYLLTDDQDAWLVFHAAFIPARYVTALDQQDLFGYIAGPVTYSLLHGGWLHLIFNSLWLIVFATPLAARIGAIRFTILWITSSAFSAFFYMVVADQLARWGYDQGSGAFLVGASGVVSATVGAACRFALALSSARQMRAAHFAPRLGIIEALGHRSVISFIAIWALSNVVLTGVFSGQSNVAWQAHLGGFLFGYLAFALFDPPLKHR